MAKHAIKTENGRRYIVVVKNDTLSEIGQEVGIPYKQLASINGISNPNYIVVGQKIYLDKAGSSGSSSSSSSKGPLVITQFGPLSKQENKMYAAWTWTKEKTTASYKVLWQYYTGEGVWFGDPSSISVDKDYRSLSRKSTFDIPDNATKVRFRLKPIAETKKDSKGNEKAQWTQGWSEWEQYTVVPLSLDPPPVPSPVTDGLKITVTYDNLDIADATSIIFQLIKDKAVKDKTKTWTSDPISIVKAGVSYSKTVEAGGEYQVRSRSHNAKLGISSDWTAYSGEVTTIPANVNGITSIKAESETSVRLSWGKVSTADSYTIEYTTNKDYFDKSDQVQSKSVDKDTTTRIIDGLESGHEYFFRVRATNSEGSSKWTPIKSIILGTKPEAPTTWSFTSTAIKGEDVVLYWVHNSEDGSSQTSAKIKLIVDGEESIVTVTDPPEEDEPSSYKFDSNSLSVGGKLDWQVQTAGILKDESGNYVYGDWSITRTVDIYDAPSLMFDIIDSKEKPLNVIESFPFYARAVAGPQPAQKPLSYHLEVIANEFYETVDNVGNSKVVNAGDAVYSKYFDTHDDLMVELSAYNVDLENGMTYTAKCVVSMDSGLTAEETHSFSVSWDDIGYRPNAEITINTETMTANIRPYCESSSLGYYQVTETNGVYTVTNTRYDFISGAPKEYGKKYVYTNTGEQVYTGISPDGDEIDYCTVEEKVDITDVFLSVYRREYDGTFIELATKLDGTHRTTITDPHPALDYARYRIVAISKSTGSVSYYDLPGYPVGGVAVIIQWDEDWSSFDVDEDAVMDQPPWSGSMLKLPYNIDVSDSNSPDIELIKYIGRSHPVTYYGTQLGTTSSWNMVIDKNDKETLYGLRRLARWMGDVYVREPSGSGYWANIAVSFSQKHLDVTIPVSLSITRVEGGV